MPEHGKHNSIIIIVLFSAALVVIVALGALYLQSGTKLSELEQQLQEQGGSNQPDSQLLNDIKQVMVLPENEQPTIATVTDPAKLPKQPFFAQAMVGDKVLIYTKAKKIILYRPGEKRVIEVAPLNDINP